MDVENIPNLEVAHEKLEELWLQLKFYLVDEENEGDPGFWEETMETYLSDYSMKYFLSTNFMEDKEMLKRVPPLLSALSRNKHLICGEDQEMSFTKIEDLCDDINRAC